MRVKPIIQSYGGGTQSVAIGVLVAQGRLPRPERVVIADTGREASETWEYTERHVQPLLGRVGLTVEVAGHDLATVDLYRDEELLLPVFTADGGKFPTYCSNEWKKRVVQRWLRANGYGPKRPVVTWIGISLDEIGRAKPSGVGWQEYRWPLLMPHAYTRQECRSIVEAAGLPTPPKSSCWMCPHRGNEQWRHLRDTQPEDWNRAVALDEEIRRRDGQGGVYLHRSMRPLSEADLSAADKAKSGLFGEVDGCDSGVCWT